MITVTRLIVHYLKSQLLNLHPILILWLTVNVLLMKL